MTKIIRANKKAEAIGIEIGAKTMLDAAGCQLKFDSATNMFGFYEGYKLGFREYTVTVYQVHS